MWDSSKLFKDEIQILNGGMYMARFGDYEVSINKDDELLDRIRKGGKIYPSDLGYVIPTQHSNVLRIVLDTPSIRTEYDKEKCTLTAKQNINDLLIDKNILAFTDDDKLYFMDKTTLEIVSEFDKVK